MTIIIKMVEETDSRRCGECGDSADNIVGRLGFYTVDIAPVCRDCAAELDPYMVALIDLERASLPVGFYKPTHREGRKAIKALAEAARRLCSSNLDGIPDEIETGCEVVH